MAASAAASRESRRRKILERGPDRLALITSRTQAPPSEPGIEPQAAVSSQPLNSQIQAVEPHITASTFSCNGDSTIAAGHSGSNLGTSSDSRQTSDQTPSAASPSHRGSIEQPPLVPSVDHRSTLFAPGIARNLESRTRVNRFVTLGQISYAIEASECSRFFCSLIVALSVVISSLGFPVLGSNVIKTITSFRPLYLLLLTNLTLVLARLLVNSSRRLGRAERENDIPLSSQDWVGQAGKALELCLVMQKVINAVLMDFSVYVTIIIAGFSLIK